MAVQDSSNSKDKNGKEYKQPDTIDVTQNEDKEKNKPKVTPIQKTDYPRELDVLRYERAKKKGEFSEHKQVRFDPNEPLEKGLKSAFDQKLLPNLLKDVQASRNKIDQDDYISPKIKENLEDNNYSTLKALRAREQELQTKTAFGKATQASDILNKSIEGTIMEDKEDDGILKSMGRGMLRGFFNFSNVVKGVGTSVATPGMSEEEENELAKIKRKINKIEEPILRKDYSILKSTHDKTEKFLDDLNKKKVEKKGISRGENEDFFFSDAELTSKVKDLHRRTEAEYESRFDGEGWWGGFTEDAPDMFNTMLYAAKYRLSDDNPENMSPAQKAFLKAYEEYEEAKQLNLNSNSAYRFFKDSFRPSVDFVGEIALTRGAGKFLGTASTISKAGKAAPVLRTIGNTVTMPATTTGALKNASSNVQVLKHLDGQKQIFTSDEQKLTAVSHLAKEKEYLDYQIQRLESQPNITEKQQKDLQEKLLMREGFNTMIDQLVDEQGELRSPERSLAEEFGKSAYETGKELLAERLGGRLDKYMPAFGNLSLMKMGTKWKSKIRKADDVLFNSNKAGKLSKALFGHVKPGTYIHSLPSEMIEELAVQATPSFDINYADQISEFANPDFYLNIAYSTLLMQGGFGAFGGAMEQGKIVVDKKYRGLVKERKNILKDLRGYYRDLDQSITDEDLAKEISMSSMGTMFKDLDYRAQVAKLRNPDKNTKGEDQNERNKKANLLEETQFINAAVMAVQTGTDAELKVALNNLIKKQGISKETKKSALRGLGTISEIKSIIKRNGNLIDAGTIIDSEIRTSMMKKQKEVLDQEQQEVGKELETLEGEFINQSDKYEAIPLDVGPITEDAKNKAVAYARDFSAFLEKKGKKDLMQKRYDAEQFSNQFAEAIGSFEQKTRKWKSQEYQNKRKQDKARAATTKKQFDAYKDSLSNKEREEREALYSKKNPKKALQDYNKKNDFKNEKKAVPDEVDIAAQEIANPIENQEEKPTQEELARENSGTISAEDLMEAQRLAKERYEDEEEALSPRQVKPDAKTLDIFQKLYSKIKGATGKTSPGTQDIVQYLVERHGWDKVADAYLGYMQGFEMIGLDVSDANDIYAKYDDIDNIALRAAGKMSKGEKPEVANLTDEQTQESTKEVDEKKEESLRKKSTIKIDGEDFNDKRTDATQTKMALTTVNRKRFGPTIYVDGNELITDDVIDNHFLLDPDFVSQMEEDSREMSGSVTLSMLNFSDGIVRKNNSPSTITINLEARVDFGKSEGDHSLPVTIAPGEEYTLGQLKDDLKAKDYSQDIIDEFMAMYTPMVYSYKDRAVSYAHNLYWYSNEAQSLNSSMSQEDRDMAKEGVRTLRRQVVENAGKIPITVTGMGATSLNQMNDDKGNIVRQKVSEAIGEVKGYDDSNIGKIGVLQKRNGEVKITFNDGSTIPLEDIADDIANLDSMKSIREGKRFEHVQIFESQLEGKPYRLNYLNDTNQSGNYAPIAKESFLKVLFSHIYANKNLPGHVRNYLEAQGLNISRAKDILSIVGDTETFYDAMSFGGNKKAKAYIDSIVNSENLDQLTAIANNLRTKELNQLKTHYYYQKKVFGIPVFDKNSFNYEEKSYQEFAREIFTTKNRTYDIETVDGNTKTIFSISPQIYTQPALEEESEIQYESSAVSTNQDLSNPEVEETQEELSKEDQIRKDMSDRGYDSETIERLISSMKQQRGDDAYSPRQLSNSQTEFLNSLDTGKIEGITTIQERIISENIIHKVALRITEGDFTNLGNKILNLVDETIDTIKKEKQDFYEILAMNDSTYTREAKENLDFITAVSKERVKLYNKAVKTFNDTIDAEIESIDDDTDVQQWAQDLEGREVTTRLSDRLKMVFYGVPKKRIQKGDVVQTFGLEEYHSPIYIFNKIKDIMTEVDGNWEDVVQQLNNKYEEYRYPIYNDIRNKLNNLDEKLKNNMLHAMTSYKATYFKIDISTAGGDMHNVRLLDENDTKKSITIVNDLKSSFKRIFGVSENNVLKVNSKLVSNLIIDIDNLGTNPVEVKEFFDKMGLNEININTWNHFIRNGKLPQITSLFKGQLNKLSKVKGPLQTKDNIFDDLNKQLRTLAKIESELNHSIVGSTKRIGDKDTSSTVPPMMVYDLNRKFLSKEEMDKNRNNPFVANGYIFKLLDQTQNDEILSNLKEQMQRLALPSLEVLKLNSKLVGRDTKYTKQGELEHFVYRAGLYTSKLNTLNLTSLALDDYRSLRFRARYLTGLTIADKSRTYIQSLPTLDLAKDGLRIGAGNVLDYSADLENFLTDNLFETQLRAIIKYYQKDSDNPYTNRNDNKAFYFIKELNIMQFNGENIHDYLKSNYDNITEDSIEQLKVVALPILKSYIRQELKKNMTKFPEAYKFIDKPTLNSYEGKNYQEKYKKFLAEYVINTSLGNMFSFQAYMKHPSFYGGMNVSKIENKNDIQEWNQNYKKFKAKVHKRTALLIAPGNIFANSKNKKIGHIAMKDVERYSDQIVEIIEQSYARETMSTEQEQQLQTLKNLIDSVKSLQKKDTLTPLEKEQLNENRKSILDIKKYFQNIEGYFQLNAADAQMYVTYRGYLDMLVGEGKITEDQRENYIKKVEDGNLSQEELDDLTLVNLQPKKPVYSYDKYDPILEESVPVYIKNSVFPLFPGLTANIRLDKLRKGMESIEKEKGFPVYASYESANKIGHKDTNITLENIYDSETGIPELESGYSELDLRGMRLQQATPSKEDKAFQQKQDAKQTLGSQMFKLLMGNNVNRIQDKIFPNLFQTIENKDEMLSGEEVDQIFFNLYEKYNNTQRNKLETELGVQDMRDFYAMNMDQQKEIIENLRNILKREVISRNYPESVLQNLDNIIEDGFVGFESPFLFDSNSYKFEALLQAIVANRLIIHKLPGNSHVVGSSEGFRGDNTLTNKERSEIVYLDKDVYDNGLKSNITKNGKLQKAQVFIKPHFSYTNEEGKYVYVDFTDPKYYEEKDGVRILNTKMIDPELLSYFSFRIPTSSHQSGALLEVGGFLPASSQDLLIVPAEHTEQIGEDYDVDARKLYKNNYFVDNDGKVVLLKPEYIDVLAEREATRLDSYLETKEKIAILKKELKGLAIEWESFGVDYSEIKEYKTDSVDNLFRAIFQEDYTEVESIIQDALEAKKSQQELANIISNTIEQADNIKKFGTQTIKKKLEFKLLENDLINVFKSVYSTDNAEFQNKVNKPLVTDVAEESANIVANKIEQTSGQEIGDILSDSAQFELLKGGADGSVAIGISSKGVVSEAQAQRIGHINPVQLKSIYQIKGGYVVEDRQVRLGGFTSDATIGKNLKTLDGKREIATAHMENQNVHTDNINKGVMAKRNENIHTLPVYVMSTHLGFNETKSPITLTDGRSKHVLLNTLLATQPIIFDYVKEKEKSSLTQDFSPDRDLEIMNSLLEKYGGKALATVNQIETQSYASTYTEQEMYDSIGISVNDMSSKEKQLQLEMLKVFMQINDMASQWVEVQNTYNLSTSKLGVSYFETLDKTEKLDKLADRHFNALSAGETPENTIHLIGEVSIEPREGYSKVGEYFWKPTTIEGLQTINSLATADKIMPIFYPYQKEFFNQMITLAESSKGENVKLSLKNKYDLMAEFTAAINAQSPVYDIYDGKVDDVRERLFIDSADNTSLGSFLQMLKESGHRIMENSFLSDLYFDSTKNPRVKRIKHLSNKDSGITPDEKYADFLSLLESQEPILDKNGENILFNGNPVTTRDIGIDLVTYEMLSDDKKGAVSFKNIIPFEYLEAVGVTKYYRDVFKNILNGFTDENGGDNTYNIAYNFIKQYFQHNPTKTKIVEKFPAEGEYMPSFITKFKGSTPELFELTDGVYEKVEILDTYDTMKQYDLKDPNRRDLVAKIESDRKSKLPTQRGVKLKFMANSANQTLVEPKGERRSLESLVNAYKNLGSLSPEQRTAFDMIDRYIDKDTKLEWVNVGQIPNRALGSYNPNTNTIRIDENLYMSILERYNPENLSEIKDIAREVIIEELIHATTIKELSKHLSLKGEFITDTPPLFAQMIRDAYETAKEALPEDYYTQNVDEFVGGMFASPEFREKLEERLPGIVERIKRAIKSLYNSLIKNSEETIKESYKKEFFAAIDDMFKYRDGALRKGSELSEEVTDINVNKFKNQRPVLKPGIKIQEPSGNETKVYNENSIFGDNLTQEQVNDIISEEVKYLDEDNNPC